MKYSEDVNNKAVSHISEIVEGLDSGVINSLLNDFSALTELGLFSEQINKIKKGLDNLKVSLENFSLVIQDNKYQWNKVESDVDVAISELGSDVQGISDTSGVSGGSYNGNGRSYGVSGGRSNGGVVSTSNGNIAVSSISKGVSVSTKSVENLIGKLDNSTLPILLQKLYKMNNNKSIVDLLIDDKKSGILLAMIKKILGDTTEDLSEVQTEESDVIQKMILKSLKVDKVDLTTEEGKTEVEEVVLENINNNEVDESKWNELIYGENTVQINLLDGEWVVAKTKSDLQDYASYIANQGVRQNSDTSKYSDYCLAFSYVHAYDLYTGNRGTAEMAGGYAHAGAFHDYIDDDKNKVLAVIYDEIMKGRPVVLQVNGNKAGTSRHFVTVVGFKAGITSADSLTEQDLLIIDSWDGQIERMDTNMSRFMTTGAACHKDYSGYRLRVLNENVA